ncbi:protein FAR1-RELATED SEQUENCE 5-like [Salvia miltiorrhiza]|uniref:protein FAR1-RELATED SEQUENCE 5-like n=1 Tax=Salvia miltiorrhiza TaxID=226208 RepID=UPI0025AD17ED|nr:protein FAR1-RELATED SEQUENCE 5-like [Salvia miltiorrhiza]
MMTDNAEETNDDTNTGGSNSHTQNDDSSSVNVEQRSENTLQIMSSAQGDLDNICGSLVGEKDEDIEKLMKLYSEHAKKVGFSVRKSTTRYNSNGMLVSRVMVCSCQGLRKNASNVNEVRKKTVLTTRTDCKAFLRIKLSTSDEGLYEVKEHVLEHNHPLTREELSYMHRSNRTISDENAVIIEDMLSSGIGATDAYRYMAQEAGGEDMIGYTKRDCINYVNRLKILTIEGGDAQTLLNILEDQSAENDDFFYRVRLDEDGKLSHVFWRDSMMKDDFTIFGDVMVFDTTYRTNKYNLICAPFVGLNNYKKNVMFGCAFLSNEKIETFVWLFETFKKSMGVEVLYHCLQIRTWQ